MSIGKAQNRSQRARAIREQDNPLLSPELFLREENNGRGLGSNLSDEYPLLVILQVDLYASILPLVSFIHGALTIHFCWELCDSV
jgi:hypothetical protein